MKYVISILLVSLLALGIASPASTGDAFSAALEKFNAGEWQQAADLLVESVSDKPDDPVRRITAGVALANLKRYPPAVEQFEEASRLAPEAALPKLLLNGVRGEMPQTEKPSNSQNLGLAPRLPWKRMEADGLRDEITQSLERYPSNAIAHCLLGDLEQLRGMLPEARKHYLRASELAPKWTKPIFNLALGALQSSPEAARAGLVQVTQMDPSNARAHLWLGDAYLREGNVDEAVRSYEQAALDAGLTAEARTRIGSARMQAGYYSQAAEDFALAEQQAPDDVRPVAGQGQVLQKMGRPEEAETKYRQAAALNSANDGSPKSRAYLQNQIGVVQAEQGRLGEAVANLADAFQVAPTRASADALVRAHQKAGQLDTALEQYEQAFRSNPSDMRAAMLLLAAHTLTGNWRGVVQAAERLAALDAALAWSHWSEVASAKAMLDDSDGAVEAYFLSIETGSHATWSKTAAAARGCGMLGRLITRYGTAPGGETEKRPRLILVELLTANLQFDRAFEIARGLAAAFPDDASLWLRLGQAAEKAGERQTAVDAYTRAAAGTAPESAALARVRLQALQER